MPRLPNVGTDTDSWGDVLNEFLRVSHREDGALKTTLKVVNVRDFGATGNGTTDDTTSIRNAIAALNAQQGGSLYFPPGHYRVTGTLSFAVQVPVEIFGNGWSSEILWSFDGNLLEWSAGTSCRECTISDLKITSSEVAKTSSSAAISCKGGAERSTFEHLLIWFQGAFFPSIGIDFVGVTDSCVIRDCQLWNVKSVGVRIGHGSEVKVIGGRIIGDNTRLDGSIGIHLTGGNGGVHVVSTDVIGLQEGIRIENSSGRGSNREIFITHATLDSCWRGLALRDDSYVSMSGCWAASCNQDNIHVDVGLSNPILAISGGTIFNAGVTGGDPVAGRNGLTVNSGSFILNGVHVRNNVGHGVWVPNSSVREYSITGCRFTDNGQALRLTGSCYSVTGNVFARNTNADVFLGTNIQNLNNLLC